MSSIFGISWSSQVSPIKLTAKSGKLWRINNRVHNIKRVTNMYCICGLTGNWCQKLWDFINHNAIGTALDETNDCHFKLGATDSLAKAANFGAIIYAPVVMIHKDLVYCVLLLVECNIFVIIQSFFLTTLQLSLLLWHDQGQEDTYRHQSTQLKLLSHSSLFSCIHVFSCLWKTLSEYNQYIFNLECITLAHDSPWGLTLHQLWRLWKSYIGQGQGKHYIQTWYGQLWCDVWLCKQMKHLYLPYKHEVEHTGFYGLCPIIHVYYEHLNVVCYFCFNSFYVGI